MAGHAPWRHVRHKSVLRRSPDVRGLRVRLEAADPAEPDVIGVVIDQVPCQLCAAQRWTGTSNCGYDHLIVELPDGERVQVYEPEADVEPFRGGDGGLPRQPTA